MPAVYTLTNSIRQNFTLGVGGTVPEPAGWAMLIAGLGLTGAAMRRRRPRIVAA